MNRIRLGEVSENEVKECVVGEVRISKGEGKE